MSKLKTIQAPFKILGGKDRMVPTLLRFVPDSFAVYAEPFLGGGALFRKLATMNRLDGVSVRLSDASKGTMRAWHDAQVMPEHLHAQLAKYEFEYNGSSPEARSAMFYRERTDWNAGGITGARHIFLRKTAFNGLWRENRRGGFNAPWGRYVKFCPPEIPPLCQALQGDVELRAEDFRTALARAEEGWVVYCDPPYIGEFNAYTAQGFGMDQQVELLQACAAAVERGARVLYSQRFTLDIVGMVEEHWPSGIVYRDIIPSTVAAKSNARGAVEEMVVWA
jgi:DNA adenine methylase